MSFALDLSLLLGSAASAGGGGGAPTFEAESEPSSITLARGVIYAGDSTFSGVGVSTSPTDYSRPGQFAGMVTNPSLIVDVALSGRGYTPTADPSDIPEQVAGAGASPLATYDVVHGTALNDYSVSVVTLAERRVWTDNTEAGMATLDGHLTGTPSQQHSWFAGGLPEGDSGPGMRWYADWRHLQNELEASRGADQFDLKRFLIFKTATSPTDLDRINVETWWDYGLSMHGSASQDMPSPVPQTAWLTFTSSSGVAATRLAALETAHPSAGKDQGAVAQNTDASQINGQNTYINTATGWAEMDFKHPNRTAYAWAAVIDRRLKAAVQGDGAPFASPFRLRLKQDDAAGTVAGTIYYTGLTAPDSIALFTEDGTAITGLTLTDNGVSGERGSITVTRSASGTLTEGEVRCVCQTTKGSWVLHTPGDFYIGQPSTQTTARAWRIPASTDATETVLSDYSVSFRADHGIIDTDRCHLVMCLRPSILGSARIALSLQFRDNSFNTDLFIRLASTGALQVVGHDADDVLVFNGNAATSAFAVNEWTWVAIDMIAPIGVTPTIQGYFQKGAAAPVTINATGPNLPTNTMNFKDTIPRLWSLKDANIYTENRGASLDTGRQQYRGDYRMVAFGAGIMGIAGNTALRDTLWDASGNPVARAPFSAIGTATPDIDWQGGPGDKLAGGFHATKLGFGTYGRTKALVAV